MNEMITITRAEYDRLREAAENLADFEAYSRAVKRMIGGESPVRMYRELREMTQTALAKVSGVNRIQIADIEAGRSKGSVETMRKLAIALSVTIDDLV